jgi:effector-binding domain-containing protein
LHFLTRPAQEQRSEQALANLKAVIEALPNVDFERLDPQFVQVSPATYAFVESEVAFEAKAVALAEAQSFESVRAYLSANALPLSAPQVLFTVRQITVRQNEERMNFRAGYVVPGDNAPIPGADSPVRLDATPSGLAMKVVLDGPRDGLRQTYGMIAAYLQAHRLKPAAGPWEVRFPALPGAATKQTRTEIYYLLR